jgi:hypothetical protein
MVLTTAFCSVTGKKIPAKKIYHLPGDGPGGIDSYCTCHDKKVKHTADQQGLR